MSFVVGTFPPSLHVPSLHHFTYASTPSLPLLYHLLYLLLLLGVPLPLHLAYPHPITTHASPITLCIFPLSPLYLPLLPQIPSSHHLVYSLAITSHTFPELGPGSNDRNHIKAFPFTVRNKDVKSVLLRMEMPPPEAQPIEKSFLI